MRFGAFRAHGTCLVAANFVLPSLRGVNSVPPNHLAGFGGHFATGERWEKRRKRGQRKVKKGTEN